jgi:hypothetical protein
MIMRARTWHELTTRLAQTFDQVAVEDLHVAGMHGRLNIKKRGVIAHDHETPHTRGVGGMQRSW